MSNILIKIIVIAFSAYTLLVLLVHGFEYLSLYHPDRVIDNRFKPFLVYEDHYVMTEDGKKINVWFFPNPDAKWIILLCHGNAGNNSHRLEQISALYNKSFSVAIFDYRGYGNSTGHPSENGLYRDGHAVIRYLTDQLKIPVERIVVIGTSLGGAVAAELATHYRFRALILESTFTSKHDMANLVVPFFPVTLLSKNQFNNLAKIKHAQSPVFIAHGQDDEMIPFTMSRQLYDAAPQPKFYYPIPGAHHNDYLTVGGQDYLNTVARFIYTLNVN
jgi:hypothetical protein